MIIVHDGEEPPWPWQTTRGPDKTFTIPLQFEEVKTVHCTAPATVKTDAETVPRVTLSMTDLFGTRRTRRLQQQAKIRAIQASLCPRRRLSFGAAGVPGGLQERRRSTSGGRRGGRRRSASGGRKGARRRSASGGRKGLRRSLRSLMQTTTRSPPKLADDPYRELVREGPLLKVNRRGKASQYHFWLFTDLFVYGQKKKTGKAGSKAGYGGGVGGDQYVYRNHIVPTKVMDATHSSSERCRTTTPTAGSNRTTRPASLSTSPPLSEPSDFSEFSDTDDDDDVNADGDTSDSDDDFYDDATFITDDEHEHEHHEHGSSGNGDDIATDAAANHRRGSFSVEFEVHARGKSFVLQALSESEKRAWVEDLARVAAAVAYDRVEKRPSVGQKGRAAKPGRRRSSSGDTPPPATIGEYEHTGREEGGGGGQELSKDVQTFTSTSTAKQGKGGRRCCRACKRVFPVLPGRTKFTAWCKCVREECGQCVREYARW